MNTIQTIYQGDLRCKCTHESSGTVLHTDAPKDNHGKGESFSPTDLVATALGSCMLTIMALAARPLNVDLVGARVSVDKHMTHSPVRRIARLEVKIHVPAAVSQEQKEKLEHAALTCPVHKSLHPDIQVPVTFAWGASE